MNRPNWFSYTLSFKWLEAKRTYNGIMLLIILAEVWILWYSVKMMNRANAIMKEGINIQRNLTETQTTLENYFTKHQVEQMDRQFALEKKERLCRLMEDKITKSDYYDTMFRFIDLGATANRITILNKEKGEFELISEIEIDKIKSVGTYPLNFSDVEYENSNEKHYYGKRIASLRLTGHELKVLGSWLKYGCYKI
jgi:hypothetical protein